MTFNNRHSQRTPLPPRSEQVCNCGGSLRNDHDFSCPVMQPRQTEAPQPSPDNGFMHAHSECPYRNYGGCARCKSVPTDFLLKCKIKKDAPPFVVELMRQVVGLDDVMERVSDYLPDHPFFSTVYWGLHGSHTQHSAHGDSSLNYTSSTGLTDVLINSGMRGIRDSGQPFGEYGLLLDWLLPYIESEPDQPIGYYSVLDNHPTTFALWYLRDGGKLLSTLIFIPGANSDNSDDSD